MNGGPDMRDAQRHHWQTTFEANSHLYGTEPSAPGAYAVELFGRERVGHVLEPGAGQGRDTLAFLRAGLRVTALYHAPRALSDLHQAAAAAGLADRLATLVHDVRDPLPLPTAGVDAAYSHMLLTMALTTAELEQLTDDVRRVLPATCTSTPFGTPVTRTTVWAPAMARTCTKNGGFIVHFFNQPLVERLAAGFTLLEVTAFEEGSLPRRLWRVTLRRLP